ncbi:MAG: ABC transporter ATP-binding protein [bacterium]
MTHNAPVPGGHALPVDHRAGGELLSARGLSRRFGHLWALRDATFTVRTGEILGLIGPNGSGKSTLFQCLAGTMPTNAGVVEQDGSALGAEDRKRVLYFMPDGIRPWPDQTVSWMLGFVRGLWGATADQYDEVMRSLGVERLRYSAMGSLSKGEHKRVLLAAALLTPQPILMLDEPFDGLDLRQTRETMEVLRRHAAKGRTLFLSIHQLGDAAKICDRFVMLSDGRVVGEGTLDELKTAAALASATPASLEEVFLALT